MSTIIKATDRNAAIHGVAFNFDDMTEQATRHLDSLRTEAAKIVAEAKKQADQIRQQAQRNGLEAARKDVYQQLAQEQTQTLSTLLPSLKKAVQDIQHAKQAWLTHWEKSAVHVAAAIAERIIRQKLPEQPEITLTLLREALELAVGQPRLRIHLHPDDLKRLGDDARLLTETLVPLAETEILANAQITQGGCRVETQFGTIDQQLETQLARIEEELT